MIYNDLKGNNSNLSLGTVYRNLKQLEELGRIIELYRDVDLTEDCRMTLGEWMDKWLDEYMIFTVRESTLDSYRSQTENQVKRFVGDRQLSTLTTADIQKFYNKIKKQGSSH